jgi:transcription antitermination factor NusG
MSSLSIFTWFAIQVRHQHEARVASLLAYKGYEYFYPTYKAPSCSGRRAYLYRPLFPGYVFCKVTDRTTGLICNTPGVIRFVSFGGKAAPIPEEQIDAVRRGIEADLNPWPFGSSLEIGQKVLVTKGPLCGIIGRLICTKNRIRLLLCVEIVMKAITVDVDINDIVPLTPVLVPGPAPSGVTDVSQVPNWRDNMRRLRLCRNRP